MKAFIFAVLLLTSFSADAATYYLNTAAGGGSDTNNGLSTGAPWLTPNHALNCGDVIIAAASTAYSAPNFNYDWGTVTCPAGNNVAWLKCVAFDACKISGMSAGNNGMGIGANYWGVQGWEVDGTTSSGVCFLIYPGGSTTIHHIVFANDIASGCGLNGFSTGPGSTTASVDYLAVVGSIAYNDAGGSIYCGSGISLYEPINYDTLPGTHNYIAGNFSWANVDGNPCNGGLPSDGEGINLDTFDGSQTGTPVYTGQTVVDNNMLLANGGPGLELYNNGAVGTAWSHIYMRHNTAWGNNAGLYQSVPACAVGEIIIYDSARNVEAYQNIAATNSVDGAASQPIYSYQVCQADASSHVYQAVGYSVGGTPGGLTSSGSFAYGPNNLFGTNPTFANPVAPGAPSCGSATSVPACMATVIANFSPTNSAASGYGYQVPSTTNRYDPLFPQWLCNVNLPSGLVTMGCLTASADSGAPLSGGKMQ